MSGVRPMSMFAMNRARQKTLLLQLHALFAIAIIPVGVSGQQTGHRAGMVEELRQLHRIDLLPEYRSGSDV